MPPRTVVAVAVPVLALLAAARLATLSDASTTEVLGDTRAWAWAAAVVLIVADLVLPVPQASVITALGAIYGLPLATFIGTVGLILSGLTAYVCMRTRLGRFIVRRLGGRRLAAIEAMTDQAGPWAIALTRSLPYSVPEIVVCLAGLARMPVRRFLVALVSGSVPAALLYAGIGAGWARQPLLALAVSYVLPILTLPAALVVMDRRRGVGERSP